MKTEDWLWDL